MKGKAIKRFRHRRHPSFVAYVHEFGCCVCGRRPVDAAHLKSKGAGGDDLGNIVPLCRAHHTEQHTIGVLSFQKRYDVDLPEFARALEVLYTRAHPMST